MAAAEKAASVALSRRLVAASVVMAATEERLAMAETVVAEAQADAAEAAATTGVAAMMAGQVAARVAQLVGEVEPGAIPALLGAAHDRYQAKVALVDTACRSDPERPGPVGGFEAELLAAVAAGHESERELSCGSRP